MSEILTPRQLSPQVQEARKAIETKGFGGAAATINRLLLEYPDDDDVYALHLLRTLWTGDAHEALRLAEGRLNERPAAGIAAFAAEASHYLARESDYIRYAAIADSLDPDHFLNLRQQANRQLFGGDPKVGTDFIRRSLLLYPEAADTYTSLCKACQLTGDLTAADELVENCPDWFRDTPQYHNRRGMLALVRRDMEAAEKELRTAVAKCPEGGSYWGNLSLVLRSISRYEEAEQAAKYGVELNSRNIVALSTLAVVARHRGDDRAAAEWDQRSENAVPAFVFQKVLGKTKALLRQKERDDAIQYLRAEIKKTNPPSARSGRRILINLLLDAKRFAEAREEWEAASKLDDDPGLRVAEFRILEGEGMEAEASALLARLLDDRPVHPKLYIPAVNHLIKSGDDERLDSFVTYLMENIPSPPTFLGGAIIALSKGGRKEQSRALHNSATRRYPENDALRLIGGMFAAEGGNMRGAIHTFQSLPTDMRPTPKLNFGTMVRDPKFWKAVFRRFRKK